MADQQYYDPTAETVTLMTIHASKGLEFPVVFVMAAEQGILPLIRKDKPADIAEERRLFYVAATRARDELRITYAKHRGKEKQELSQFVRDLPQNVTTKTVDTAMQTQINQIKKRAQKRSQTSLF
jgi:DNA helicase-2/ATP-dependent DNA helicase PcrA